MEDKAVRTKSFAGDPAQVAGARRFVVDAVREAGQVDMCETAALLTSELATNAVQHAATSFDVVVAVGDDVIRVEVHDGSAVTEAFRDLIRHPPTQRDPTVVGGRGILVLGRSALRVGLDDKGDAGKAVWFELATAPHDSRA